LDPLFKLMVPAPDQLPDNPTNGPERGAGTADEDTAAAATAPASAHINRFTQGRGMISSRLTRNVEPEGALI
jgi:hypothetical protein